MKYRTINILTGCPITGTKKVKVLRINTINLANQINSYTARQVNFGRPEGWAASQDLNDHSKRPMPGSMLRSIHLYGTEWSAISKAAREAANWACQECHTVTEPRDLHVHHIKTINSFIRAGAAWVKEHLCHGVKTKRPYHTETNLRVLCRSCHGDEHGRNM